MFNLALSWGLLILIWIRTIAWSLKSLVITLAMIKLDI